MSETLAGRFGCRHGKRAAECEAILRRAIGALRGAAPATLFERALAIYDNALGPDHPHTATVRKNLASLLEQSG